jgi:hypothetical protein
MTFSYMHIMYFDHVLWKLDCGNLKLLCWRQLVGCSFSYLPCKAVGSQGYCRDGKRGMEIQQIRTEQRLLSLITFNHFSWINTGLFSAKFWKSWFWTFFTRVLIAFMQKDIFWGPYCSIPEVILPFSVTWKSVGPTSTLNGCHTHAWLCNIMHCSFGK